jgi:hypothetical protein
MDEMSEMIGETPNFHAKNAPLAVLITFLSSRQLRAISGKQEARELMEGHI